MPELVARPLRAVGEDLDDWLTLHRLDPAYRANFADGSSIDVRADVEDMCDEIARTCGPADAAGYREFVAYLRRLYELQMPHFIDRNLDSPLQLVGLPLAKLAAMGGFGKLGAKVGQFVKDERLRRLFSFQAMYAGMSPAQALAIYSVITYMDCVEGVYFPEGGMHAVPRARAGAAAVHGVNGFRFGTTVSRVEISGGPRHAGVITADGDRIPADVVVVNADLPTAYAELLPPGYTPRRVKRLTYSPSAVVLHAGSSASYPDLRCTTRSEFGSRLQDDTFRQIIDRGQGDAATTSFLLDHADPITDPSLAPAGRHTYYALFPTPNLARASIDWSGTRPVPPTCDQHDRHHRGTWLPRVR